MSTAADVIVVGLGAMGSAVAYQAAKEGMSVIGIDQFDPPHTMGSSHAETRISRLAVGEGPQYLPFVARSHELWRELELASGEALFHQCGGLIACEPGRESERWSDFVSATADIAGAAGIAFNQMTPAEVEEAHPTLRIPSSRRVGFEPTAGLVMNERAVAVQLEQARRFGADLRCHELVVEIDPHANGVTVRTSREKYQAGHVVLAAGPWLPGLAQEELARQLSVTRQVVFWFEAEDLDAFSTDHHPFLMSIGDSEDDYFAVFPRPPGTTAAIKVLGEQFEATTTPERVERAVSEVECRAFHERFIAPFVDGLTSHCVRSEVCLYTNTADDHFVIDTDPRSDRLTVMSPCSGHGFKHSAALGEAIAQRIASGTSSLDLEPFRVAR